MENQKVRNWLNFDESDLSFEPENKLPSMTVPDLSLTVPEIYERMQMGLPPEGERVPIYDEGQPYPNISKMDLTERQQFTKHYEEMINQLLTPKQATEEAQKLVQIDKDEKKVTEEAYREELLD